MHDGEEIDRLRQDVRALRRSLDSRIPGPAPRRGHHAVVLATACGVLLVAFLIGADLLPTGRMVQAMSAVFNLVSGVAPDLVQVFFSRY